MSEKRPFKCILWGGYGWGNVGDELTLAVALRDMQRRFGESVAILSPVPGYTKALFPTLEVIPYKPVIRQQSLLPRIANRIKRSFASPSRKYDINAQLSFTSSKHWTNSIRSAELLYLVGGGYLTDLFDVEYSLLPVEIARYSSVSVETAPLGIGPFRSQWAANKLKCALRNVKVYARDSDSKSICRDLGIASEIRPDDGFRIREVMEISDPPSRSKLPVGINFFVQQGGSSSNQITAWWKTVVQTLVVGGIPVEGFCFHNLLVHDYSQTVQLFAEAELPVEKVACPDVNFRDACRRLSGYSAIITARFHAVVGAGAIGLPSLAVSDGQYYRSKMGAACQNHATSQLIEPSKTEPYQVLRILQQLLSFSQPPS